MMVSCVPFSSNIPTLLPDELHTVLEAGLELIASSIHQLQEIPKAVGPESRAKTHAASEHYLLNPGGRDMLQTMQELVYNMFPAAHVALRDRLAFAMTIRRFRFCCRRQARREDGNVKSGVTLDMSPADLETQPTDVFGDSNDTCFHLLSLPTGQTGKCPFCFVVLTSYETHSAEAWR